MNDTHRASLQALQNALQAATENGTLDYLLTFVSDPDCINRVCDAVTAALETNHG